MRRATLRRGRALRPGGRAAGRASRCGSATRSRRCSPGNWHRRSTSEGRDLLAALELATSWEAWNLLREHEDCSPAPGPSGHRADPQPAARARLSRPARTGAAAPIRPGFDGQRPDLERGQGVVEVGHQDPSAGTPPRDRSSGCRTDADPRPRGRARPRCRRTGRERRSAVLAPHLFQPVGLAPCWARTPWPASRSGRSSAGGSRSRGTGCPTRTGPVRGRTRRPTGGPAPASTTAGSMPAMAQKVGARSTCPTGSVGGRLGDAGGWGRAPDHRQSHERSRCGRGPCRSGRSRPPSSP